VQSSDDFELRWSSSNAVNCSLFGDGTANGPVSLSGNQTLPATILGTVAGDGEDYLLQCNSGSDSDSDRVTVRLENTVPNLTFAAYRAYPSGPFNTLTRTYESVTVEFIPTNTGDVPISVESTYRVEANRSTQQGQIEGIAANSDGSIRTAVFSDVSANRPVPIIISLDTRGDIVELDESDNVVVFTTNLALPDPDLSITAEPIIVRNNRTAEISWEAIAPYNLECRIEGPGINPAIVDTVAPYRDSVIVGPIVTKSTYTFSCTEPNTGTTWSEEVEVETVGGLEEV
jgi:hypothetical protein